MRICEVLVSVFLWQLLFAQQVWVWLIEVEEKALNKPGPTLPRMWVIQYVIPMDDMFVRYLNIVRNIRICNGLVCGMISSLCRYQILGCRAWSTTHFCHPNQLEERWEEEKVDFYFKCFLQIFFKMQDITELNHSLSFDFHLLAWVDGTRGSPEWAFKWKVSWSNGGSSQVHFQFTFELGIYAILYIKSPHMASNCILGRWLVVNGMGSISLKNADNSGKNVTTFVCK